MMKMIPADSGETFVDGRAEAAVSIIRCRQPADSVLLLRRKITERDPWSGHFAFPGGRRDLQDQTIYDTCLRETLEETGIGLEESALRRTLDVTMAGSRVKAPISVQPYLFELEERPSVFVEVSEITSYHWLDIELFCNTRDHVKAEVLPEYFFPAYPLEDYYLWGFTYGLLCRILNVEQHAM